MTVARERVYGVVQPDVGKRAPQEIDNRSICRSEQTRPESVKAVIDDGISPVNVVVGLSEKRYMVAGVGYRIGHGHEATAFDYRSRSLEIAEQQRIVVDECLELFESVTSVGTEFAVAQQQ